MRVWITTMPDKWRDILFRLVQIMATDGALDGSNPSRWIVDLLATNHKSSSLHRRIHIHASFTVIPSGSVYKLISFCIVSSELLPLF